MRAKLENKVIFSTWVCFVNFSSNVLDVTPEKAQAFTGSRTQTLSIEHWIGVVVWKKFNRVLSESLKIEDFSGIPDLLYQK